MTVMEACTDDERGVGYDGHCSGEVEEACNRMINASNLAIAVAVENGLYPWTGSNGELTACDVALDVISRVEEGVDRCGADLTVNVRAAEVETAMNAYQITEALRDKEIRCPIPDGSTTMGLRGAVAELLVSELNADLQAIEEKLEKRLNKLAADVARSQLPEKVLDQANWKRFGLSFIRNGGTIVAITEVYSMIVKAFRGTPGEGELETYAAFMEDLFTASRMEDRVNLKELRKVVRSSGIRESSDNIRFRELVTAYIGGINRDRDECLTAEKVVELRAAFSKCSILSDRKKQAAEAIMEALEEKYPELDEGDRERSRRGLLSKAMDQDDDVDPQDLDSVGYSGELVNLAVGLARLRKFSMTVAGVVVGLAVVGVPGAVLLAEAVVEATAISCFRGLGELWNGAYAVDEIVERWGIRRSSSRTITTQIEQWASFTSQCCDEIMSAANLDDGWTEGDDGSRLVKTVLVQSGSGSGKKVTATIYKSVNNGSSGVVTCEVHLAIGSQSGNDEGSGRIITLHIPVNSELFFGSTMGHRPVLMGGGGMYASAYRDARAGCESGDRTIIPWSMRDYVVQELRSKMAMWQDCIAWTRAKYEEADKGMDVGAKSRYQSGYINACNEYADFCKKYVWIVGELNDRLEISLLENLGRYRGMRVNAFYSALLKVVYPSLKRLGELGEDEQKRWLSIACRNQQLMTGLSLLSDILDSPSSGFLVEKMNGSREVGFLGEFKNDSEVLTAVNSTIFSLEMFIVAGGITSRIEFLENVISMAGVIFNAYDGKALPTSIVQTMGLSGHQDGKRQGSILRSYMVGGRNGSTARKIASGLMDDRGYPRVSGGSILSQNIGKQQILRAFKRR